MTHACAICGAASWSPLPNPGPRCMASDWRVLDEPLDRWQCGGCGVAWRRPIAHLFADRYRLYAHAPGGAREAARQALYAEWIAAQVPVQPRRVIDAGCGNGSLLLALGRRWPGTALAGCDPAADGVAHASAAGLGVWTGGIEDRPAGIAADLIVSVNVIEHTADPVAFLTALRAALEPGGTVVVICPDGSRPGVELLMADHVHSFSPPHLQTLMQRVGFQATGTSPAPELLGAFHGVWGSDPICDATQSLESRRIRGLTPERTAARKQYLERWASLDAELLRRIPGTAVCFGAGEAAGLLRAYAPSAWSRVTACTTDDGGESPFAGVPMRPLDDVARDETILVGVRPADQPGVAERLRASWPRVVTWYDLVDG